MERSHNCSVCSLAALCVVDARNTLGCLTVCPNCSNVSVPVAIDNQREPFVQYVTLKGVHKACVAAVMCGSDTMDKDYRCPACGFAKGRSPAGHALKRIERAQFMCKVHD